MIQAFLDNPNLLLTEFNEMARIAQSKSFITIGVELQKDEINTLELYRGDLAELKKQFVERNQEPEANLVYCIDAILRVMQYELEMLVNIKEDKMAEAWGNLANAQTILPTAIRNLPFEEKSLYNYVVKLTNYERLLFPKLYFSSVGGIIKKSECSICHQDPNLCDHLKGKLYMGELCLTLISEMELEEVSFVDNPANKHCRIMTIEHDEKTIDILTLREVEKKSNRKVDKHSLPLE